MRILACTDQYAPVGGAEIYLLDVLPRLEGRGHETGVLHDAPAAEALAGLRPAFRVPGALGFLHDTSAAVVEKALEAVRAFAPDVLFLHQAMNPAVSLALAEEAPAVRYVHDLRLTCPTGRRLPRAWDGICAKPFDIHCLWKAHTQRCMPRRPDTALRVWRDVRRNLRAGGRMGRLLVASRYVRDLLVRGGMPEEKVEILPYYTELSPAIEAVAPSAERQVLSIGRPAPEKGFQHLIEALPLIREPATLEIASEGPYIEELRRLAAKVPGRHTVLFSGWISRDRITERYARARVVAVPSVVPEAFGLVGTEAMAHGLPVVAFDVGGIPEWLADGETGTLVPRKDIPALARALEDYLSDPDLALRHGAAGRARVRERYLPGRHLDRLVEVFEEMTARQGGRAASTF